MIPRSRRVDSHLAFHAPLDRHVHGGWPVNTIGTFARTTTATYIDPADGLLKTAAINVPRFEAAGLLMEGQSTNYFLNSATPASHTSGSCPTGTYTLWMDGAGSVAVEAGTATGSGWATADAATPRTITITGAGTVVFTVTGSPTRAQFENSDVRSSFIPTTDEMVERAKDELEWPLSDQLKQILSDNNEVTVVLEWTPDCQFSETALVLHGNNPLPAHYRGLYIYRRTLAPAELKLHTDLWAEDVITDQYGNPLTTNDGLHYLIT